MRMEGKSKSEITEELVSQLKNMFPDSSQLTFIKTYMGATLARKSSGDIISEFPNIREIREGLNNLSNCTNIADLRKLRDMKTLIFDLQTYYCRRAGYLEVGLNKELPFEQDVCDIMDKIDELAPPNFRKPFSMTENEEINGYKLFTIDDRLFAYDDFLEYQKLWESNDQLDKSTFEKEYNKIACADWSKMQPDGTSFGGFYDYPEGSHERENAHMLTRNQNCEALWDLPYPKKFILETIKIGCSWRRESVRRSNFMCEWMKRKINQLNSSI